MKTFKLVKVREGSVDLLVPQVERITQKMPVFFNPLKSLDRDLSVTFLRAFSKQAKRNLLVCDLLSASGVRGLRYACEVDGIESIVLNDANPVARELIEKNLELNKGKLKCQVEISQLEANRLLYSLGKKFDVIDVDPYGSPNRFLNASILSLKRHGALAITSTDTAPLCGAYPRACFRKYGAFSHRTEYYGEEGVRILAKKVIEVGAQYELALTPVFAYFLGSHMRIFFKLDVGARKADTLLERIGFVLHCDSCLFRSTLPRDEVKSTACPSCGSKACLIGPLFTGTLWDEFLCRDMYAGIVGASGELVSLILDELRIGGVTHYATDAICKVLKRPEPKLRRVLTEIASQGYKVSRTHFSPKGFRTNMDFDELMRLFKRL